MRGAVEGDSCGGSSPGKPAVPAEPDHLARTRGRLRKGLKLLRKGAKVCMAAIKASPGDTPTEITDLAVAVQILATHVQLLSADTTSQVRDAPEKRPSVDFLNGQVLHGTHRLSPPSPAPLVLVETATAPPPGLAMVTPPASGGGDFLRRRGILHGNRPSAKKKGLTAGGNRR